MSNKNNDENNGTTNFLSGTPSLKEYFKEKSKSSYENQSNEYASKIKLSNYYDNLNLVDIQKKTIGNIDAKAVEGLKTTEELQNYIESIIVRIINNENLMISAKDRNMIIQAIMDEIKGMGPLQNLLCDETVSEIMVNSPEQVYVEKKGKLILTDVRFRDNQHVLQIIDKIVSPLGRRVDEGSPMVDARLPDGSRVNAIIPPLAIKGPCVTIRKFSAKPLTIDNLISYNSLNEKMAKFLEMAVLAKSNIIVAGGTGSGKTTFLNVLSSFIPKDERVITIEDAAELRLNQPHIVSLEARPANIENKGEVSIRDLLKNSLRMRPDRIVVGEVRGAEALDMLQAMNTGHNGSLSTIHSNSARDAISRLATIVLYSGIDFPIKSIYEQICSAIDLIVYTERLADGSRKITNITEVLGMDKDIILLQDIFYFEKTINTNISTKGVFMSSGVRPKILGKFQSMGMNIGEW